jgi:hypothetical protein
MRNLRRDFHRCVDLRMIGEPSASRIVCFRRHASFEIAYVILSRREASGRATPRNYGNYGDTPSNTDFPTSASTMGKTEKGNRRGEGLPCPRERNSRLATPTAGAAWI